MDMLTNTTARYHSKLDYLLIQGLRGAQGVHEHKL